MHFPPMRNKRQLINFSIGYRECLQWPKSLLRISYPDMGLRRINDYDNVSWDILSLLWERVHLTSGSSIPRVERGTRDRARPQAESHSQPLATKARARQNP